MRRFYLALCLALLASQAWGGAAFVQSKATSPDGTTSATTVAATFTSTVGNAGAVCGVVSYQASGAALSTVTDDKSNSYTVQRTVTNQDVKMSTFYLANITNAPSTITATFASATQYRSLIIIEASGIATASALDVETGQASLSPGGGANDISSGSVTTTADGDFICGFVVETSAFNTNEFTAGTSVAYTKREENGGANQIDMAAETFVQSTQGAIAATFAGATAGTTGQYDVAILTLKAAAASAPIRHRVVH